MNNNHGVGLLASMKNLRKFSDAPQKPPKWKSKYAIFDIIKGKQKYKQKFQGIFGKLTFCLPLLDQENDPKEEKVGEILKGIHLQGGKITEYNECMWEEEVTYLLIDQNTDVAMVKQKMKGKINYTQILNYNYIEKCLKQLKKLPIEPFILNDLKRFKREGEGEGEGEGEHQHGNKKIITNEGEAIITKKRIEESIPQTKTSFSQPFLQEKVHQHQKKKEELTTERQVSPVKESNQYQQKDEEGQDSQTTEKYCFDSDPENQDKHECELKEEQRQEHQVKCQGEEEIYIKKHKEQEDQTTEDTKEKQKEKTLNQKDTEEEQHRRYEQKIKERNRKKEFPWEKRYKFVPPPQNLATHSFEMNNRICAELLKMQEIYARTNNIKNFNFIKAITLMKAHPKQIKHVSDLKELHMAPGIKQKIKQFLQHGNIAELDIMERREDNVVIKQLTRVIGVGAKKAKQFYEKGIKSIKQLRARPDLHNNNMKIGLQYFDELQKRIPREKVTRIFQFLKKIFNELVQTDKSHILNVAGSYRREKPTCGDIDLLICRKDESVERNLMINFVAKLEQKGFITDSLSVPKTFDGKSPVAYMGVCIFEGAHHRIDIKHYPNDQYFFALLYFTGSDFFNRMMRNKAFFLGLTLSDQGFKKKERNGQQNIWKGGDIPSIFKDQKEIFDFLQLDYCEPPKRDI